MTVARLLIVLGLALVVGGLVLAAASRLGLGRLPGDITIGPVTLLLGTSVVLSVLLTIILNLFLRR